VVIDGYEGDYATRKESLATSIPVATLDDLNWIAKNPEGAFKILAERAGIQETSSPGGPGTQYDAVWVESTIT
jgi:hypothetical protein